MCGWRGPTTGPPPTTSPCLRGAPCLVSRAHNPAAASQSWGPCPHMRLPPQLSGSSSSGRPRRPPAGEWCSLVSSGAPTLAIPVLEWVAEPELLPTRVAADMAAVVPCAGACTPVQVLAHLCSPTYVNSFLQGRRQGFPAVSERLPPAQQQPAVQQQVAVSKAAQSRAAAALLKSGAASRRSSLASSR